jgi:hypothetical protein
MAAFAKLSLLKTLIHMGLVVLVIYTIQYTYLSANIKQTINQKKEEVAKTKSTNSNIQEQIQYFRSNRFSDKNVKIEGGKLDSEEVWDSRVEEQIIPESVFPYTTKLSGSDYSNAQLWLSCLNLSPQPVNLSSQLPYNCRR